MVFKVLYVILSGFMIGEVAETGVGLPGRLKIGEPLPSWPNQAGPWFGTKAAPKREDADGRFGILFVFRQGSSASRRTLSWLSNLKKRRPELRFLAIHTPRHSWEWNMERLERLFAYEEISMPILQDNHANYWHRAGFSAYPTVILFGPEGRVLDFREGRLKLGGLDW